jgi:glucans biosynthesis protein
MNCTKRSFARLGELAGGGRACPRAARPGRRRGRRQPTPPARPSWPWRAPSPARPVGQDTPSVSRVQTFEGRRENLAQANKLSRTYATLLEALNRHRGKGQQKSRSSTSTSTGEHRRLSATSPTRGVGVPRKARINPMLLDMQQAPRCRARSKRSGKPCRSPAVKGSAVCRMHGARGGAPKGNRNALKHGRFSAEATRDRRVVAELIKRSRQLVGNI